MRWITFFSYVSEDKKSLHKPSVTLWSQSEVKNTWQLFENVGIDIKFKLED